MEDELRGPLPVKVNSTSNGEFRPVPLAEHVARANSEAEQQIGENAKRVGFGRRAYLQSLCGAATTFLTLNKAFAALGNTGGVFRLPKESAFETAAAADVWPATNSFSTCRPTWSIRPALGAAPRANIGSRLSRGTPKVRAAGGSDRLLFRREVHQSMCSWTATPTLQYLRCVPALPENNPLSLEEADRVRVLVNRLDGADQLYLHSMVIPNAGPEVAPLQLMKDAVDRHPIAAWKCYTQWGPNGVGFELDSPDVGIPFIERARELGVRNICIHKGVFFESSDGIWTLRRCRPGCGTLPRHEFHHIPLRL